jgi:TolB-like protein/Tfp pilus assembly protein PilF
MASQRKYRQLGSPRDEEALRLRVLGHFEIIAPDERSIDIPTKKNRGLLAILALSPSARSTRERLCGLLWGDRTEDQARSSLRQSLAVLRKELGDHEQSILQTRDDVVGLQLKSLHVDAADFLRLAESPDRESLRQAESFYRGELLQDTSIREAAFEEWLAASRRHLADRAIAAFEKLARLETGQTAIEVAKRLCDLDPLREASHRTLIAAFVAAGERGLALKQYETCRSILSKELDVLPSEEMETLRRTLNISTARKDTRAKPDPLPAIAVLPFVNMSDDRDSRYFSDGISEDIITELARFRTLFVIASNSSFRYRDSALSEREIGKELGAQYIVRGSIRRSGSRLRIAARLLDATSGNQLWGERYDRNIDDLFDVQDDVTRTIVATVTGRVESAEISDSIRKPTSNLDAYDKLLRGIEYARGYGENENRQARESFEEATRLDPHFALAHAYLALALLLEHEYENAPRHVVDRAIGIALEAVRLDPTESRCHQFLAVALLIRGDFDVAHRHFEKALELNPNDANAIANMGTMLAAIGRANEGAELYRRAMQLNPFHPDWYWVDLGFVLYDARRYQDALEAFQRVGTRKKYWLLVRVAACFAQLGQTEQAQIAAEEALRLKPDFRVSRQAIFYANPADVDHVRDGMRKAGLPE